MIIHINTIFHISIDSPNLMDNKQKGDEYEQFVCDDLNTEQTTTIAYLWKDVPEQILYDTNLITDYNEHRLNRKNTHKINSLKDVGIDIILVKQDDIQFVQCKNYTNTIPLCDLAGFFMMMAKHIEKNGTLYYTSELSVNIVENIGNDKRIKLIRKTMHSEENVDENNNEIVDEKKPEIQEIKYIKEIKLYGYQKKIVKMYNKYYIEHLKAILAMPCGTGKTIISCYIGKQYDRVIFISPLKQFAEQNIARFEEYDNERKCLLVDSEGIRDQKLIKKFLRDNPKTLLSVTYDSCDVIQNFIKDSFIIVDEFHNLSKTNVFDENDNINKIISSESKILFMSATPRIYELENNDDLCTEDIKNMFGETVFKMDFKTSIENKYICDYKIYLPTTFGNKYLALKRAISKEINKKVIPDDLLAKQCFFLFEAVKNLGTLKCIIYFKSCDEITQFIDAFDNLNRYYGYDYQIDQITHKDTKKKRKNKLNNFNNSEITSFLCSVNILNECIDIPKCNSIYVTYNCKSKISCIQRMCRAMRIDNKKSKKIAKILLFCNEIDEVLTYISAIKELDLDFGEKINYLECCNELRKTAEIDAETKRLNKLYKQKIIGIKEYQGFNWNNMLVKLEKYINKHKRRPTYHDKNPEIRTLGSWTNRQHRIYAKRINIMKNKKIRKKWKEFLDKYKNYFQSANEIWHDTLLQVKKYIDKHGHKPKQTSKNLEIKTIAVWLGRQQKNYNDKIHCMKQQEIRNAWKEFIKKYKQHFMSNEENWYMMLNKIKEYINEHEQRPTTFDKNQEVKTMANWINTQNRNYAKKIQIMKNKDILKQWEEFNNEYKKYLLTNVEIWYNVLDDVEKYVIKHKQVPSTHEPKQSLRLMRQWLDHQKRTYPKSAQIMKQPDVRKRWKEFINKYGKYFRSNNDKWDIMLEKVIAYINLNKKLPTAYCENKNLGAWINKQKIFYARKEKAMCNEELRKKWRTFVKSFSQYFSTYLDKL